MKRIFIASVLLVVTASICLYGTITLKKECDKMTDVLNVAVEITLTNDNFDEIRKINSEIKKQWAASHKVLAKLVIHSSLEPIEENVDQLESSIINNDIEKYRELCMSAAEHLNHLKSSEKISLENIF